MRHILILYASLSGNTGETAQFIQNRLKDQNTGVTLYNIGDFYMGGCSEPAPFVSYDVIFFGSYTWDSGKTPDEVKDFIADMFNEKPEPVYVFGTGEMQFGEKWYCRAADRLGAFFNTPAPVLKIEQSPRGNQEEKITHWLNQL